jgi:trigger factor
MQFSLADAGPLRKQLTLTYTPSEVAARRSAVLREFSGEVRLNGFRKGKTSNAVMEKRFGGAASERTEELLVQEGLRQAFTENKVEPVGPMENESIDRADGLRLVLSFEIKPAIAIPDAKTLGIVDETITIPDADVETTVATISRRGGAMSALAADETVIADDSVTLAGNVTVDGAEIRKLHDYHHLVGGYPLFGKSDADVVAAFAGKKVGDQIAFDTTLPANFTPAEHAGKTAHVSFTIQAAERLRAAVLDDAFAQRMGFPALAQMRDALRARMTDMKTGELRQKQVKQLTDALLDQTTVEIPPKLLEKALADADRAAEADVAAGKATDAEAAKATARANVTRAIKRSMILDAIASSRHIQVTRQDLAEQIQLAAQQTGRKPEEIAAQLQKSRQGDQVIAEIREAKTLEAYLDEALGRPAANPAHGEDGHVHGPDCGPAHGEAGHVHGPDCNH